MSGALEDNACRHRIGAVQIAKLELDGVAHRSVDHQAPRAAVQMRSGEVVAPEVRLDGHRVARHLISLYCSAAILTDDAVAVLDGVQIDKYHDYKHAYRK